MKKAILATVVSVERNSLESVVVELESEELENGSEIVSTGLDRERSCKSTRLGLEVTCAGDPRAETGDTVPVVISSEQGNWQDCPAMPDNSAVWSLDIFLCVFQWPEGRTENSPGLQP